ncbi:MAG: sulfite exporter TauE/SafE family protein [Bacteroidota bacterium]
MEYVVIALTALLASLLTFFSGFGLGTLLTPVFIIFFPPGLAIALTGVVHLLNNMFKLGLTFPHINRGVLLRFGLASVPAAFLGAWALSYAESLPPVYSYELGGRLCTVTPVKLLIAVLILLFTLMESLPVLKNMHARKEHLIAGGLISGFFGGLSGHQGALRTVFLVRSGLSKESFIATGIAIACMVDLTRLPVYFSSVEKDISIKDHLPVLSCAVLAAFAGAYLGSRLLKKTTLGAVQAIVSIALILLAIALGSGLI